MTINSIHGSIIVVYNGDNMISIRQEGSGAEVKVSLDEAESLAKALFGKRNEILKKLSPSIPTPQPQPVIPPSPPKKSKSSTSYKAKQMAAHPNAYQLWTEEEEKKLSSYYNEGRSVDEIAQILGRNEGSIRSRLKRMSQ